MTKYSLLAIGKAGDLEISLDYDNKYKVYMNIDTKSMFIFFLVESDELQLIKSMISFLKDDGLVTWQGATRMKLGKFGDFVVELLRDEEFEDRMILLVSKSGKSSMSYELNKEELVQVCKSLLEDMT